MSERKKRLRKDIDDIDRQILRLLKKRLSIAKQIGAIKRRRGAPIRDVAREEKILLKLRREAQKIGLSAEDTEAIYKEIIASCRQAQETVKVAFLGPYGTFTEVATRKFFSSSGTGLIPCTSIRDVFREVETGEASHGVVPVESSTEGSVTTTFDQLLTSNLMVYGEIELQVKHNLIIHPKTDLKDVEVVLSHPQAIAQCKGYLEEHLPGAEVREVSSTAKAVKALSDAPNAAAIGTDLAASIYGMKVAARGIQDNPRNYTRFFVLASGDHPKTKRDKTSIIFSVTHTPGSLYRALEVFAERNINVSKIESRPTKQKRWDYVFFLDFEGHRSDKIYQEAIKNLRTRTLFVKVLGSYPTWIGR